MEAWRWSVAWGVGVSPWQKQKRGSLSVLLITADMVNSGREQPMLWPGSRWAASMLPLGTHCSYDALAFGQCPMSCPLSSGAAVAVALSWTDWTLEHEHTLLLLLLAVLWCGACWGIPCLAECWPDVVGRYTSATVSCSLPAGQPPYWLASEHCRDTQRERGTNTGTSPVPITLVLSLIPFHDSLCWEAQLRGSDGILLRVCWCCVNLAEDYSTTVWHRFVKQLHSSLRMCLAGSMHRSTHHAALSQMRISFYTSFKNT